MCSCEKYNLLNDLIEPFGFSYYPDEDIFTSRLDAMQREFGYTGLYDNGAALFNMVFDCEPIYFNYQGKTWLIQMWKGQYGINIGGEVGVYRTNSIIPVSLRRTALFDSVSDDEMLDIGMELFDGHHSLFYIRQKHWWLTGFVMGLFATPRDLTAKVSIAFPNTEMLSAFNKALIDMGYTENDFFVCDLTVYIDFILPFSKCPCRRYRFRRWQSQKENRFFLRLYRFFTRPFCQNVDRLLFLYFHFPLAFRHMCKVRIHKKRGRR